MIIYFTGTGNSLSIARELSEILNEKLIHIHEVDQNDLSGEKLIGIVYPVYYGDIPDAVRDSIKKMPFTGAEYIFGITVHGGDPGNCLHTLQDILKEKGCDLSYGEEILTPVNSRIMYGRITTDIENRVKEARSTARRIAEDVKDRKNNSNNIKKRLIPTIMAKLPVMSLVKKISNKKVDQDRCIRCGTCEKVCSLNNIKVTESGVHIGDNCTDCFACVHWCPEAAIGFGNRKIKKEQQYHHPDIGLEDMIL